MGENAVGAIVYGEVNGDLLGDSNWFSTHNPKTQYLTQII